MGNKDTGKAEGVFPALGGCFWSKTQVFLDQNISISIETE